MQRAPSGSPRNIRSHLCLNLRFVMHMTYSVLSLLLRTSNTASVVSAAVTHANIYSESAVECMSMHVGCIRTANQKGQKYNSSDLCDVRLLYGVTHTCLPFVL